LNVRYEPPEQIFLCFHLIALNYYFKFYKGLQNPSLLVLISIFFALESKMKKRKKNNSAAMSTAARPSRKKSAA